MMPFGQLAPLFKRFAGVIYPKETRRLVKTIVHPMEPGSCVLDLGGGTGILSEIAGECRPDLTYFILDTAMGMLENAPGYLGKVSGKAEDLPFREGTFEAVLIGDAIHHFKDPRKAVVQIKRVLKQRGKLFVFDIDPGTFVGCAIRIAERLFGEPAFFYSPENLGNMLSGEGFIVEINRYDWRYSVKGELT
jgi:ubiquinone/menaquinone biosynthesis C-methylase UbiE